jgi:ankyrin repeat protein
MSQEEGDLGVILRDVEVHQEAQNPGFGVTEVEDPLTQLQLLIEAGDYDAASLRLQTHSHEILPVESVAGCKGRNLTALHLACESGDCPFDLIQHIIAVQPMVVAMKDTDGNTPLHMACASEHAYNPNLIATLVAAFPQAVLMQDKVEHSTPLHMLLLMGGEVNLTSLSIILDVAYSRMAALPDTWVPVLDFIITSLDTTVQIAAQYPPIVTQVIREMAINNPFAFPPFLRPFLNLPAPETSEGRLQMFDDQKKILLMVDIKKQTPLHTATVRGLSVQVVKKLLNAARYQGAHEAACVIERKLRYPLHYAGVYGMPIEAIKLIFDLNKDAVHLYEWYRLLPVQMTYLCLVNSFEDRKLELTSAREDRNSPIEDFFKYDTACALYKKVEFFLRLTHTNSYEDVPGKDWRVVHAAMAVRVPPLFIRAAIDLHPWQIRERDENLNLPLHLSSKIHYQSVGCDDEHIWAHKDVAKEYVHFRLVKEDRERDAPIAICLKYFPDGARYLDAEGSLPLHCAVRTGKGWIEGVKQLISVEPMALQSKDGVYGMYPFMLAAMEDNNTLDMVFRLLQANPSVVEGGIFTRCSLQMKQYASMKVDVEDCKRPTVVHNDDENDRKPPALPSLLKKQKIEGVS